MDNKKKKSSIIPLFFLVFFVGFVFFVLGSSVTEYKSIIGLKTQAYAESETKEESFPNATMGELNALKAAKTHLKYSSYSRSGLMELLEYEGYTAEEATFGVSNCDADWFEQAAKAAKTHLKYSSYSKKGLIELLEYEGFTTEEAGYAATKAGY